MNAQTRRSDAAGARWVRVQRIWEWNEFDWGSTRYLFEDSFGVTWSTLRRPNDDCFGDSFGALVDLKSELSRTFGARPRETVDAEDATFFVSDLFELVSVRSVNTKRARALWRDGVSVHWKRAREAQTRRHEEITRLAFLSRFLRRIDGDGAVYTRIRDLLCGRAQPLAPQTVRLGGWKTST